MSRATLRLGLACDNACLFCAQEGLPTEEPLPGAVLFDRLRALRSDANEISFVGGEPTLHPALVSLVEEARRLGFVRIGLQTNGRRLADEALVTALRQAGLTDLHLSVHGGEPAVHDHHVGTPGAFAEVVRTLSHARAAGLTVVATTVLSRSNHRVLEPLARFLRGSGVAAWSIAIPVAAGAAVLSFERTHPRLGIALPFALHALEIARSLGMPAFLEGAPLCALGPFAAKTLPSPSRSYGAACDGCPSRARCPGIDPLYLARFDGDELAAKDAPLMLDEQPALRRMFVGVGERAPVDVARDRIRRTPGPLVTLGTR